MFVVGRNVNMLSKVEGEKREELTGEAVRRIIEINVKVASDDKFMTGGSRKREEGMEVLKKNIVWFRKWRRRSVDVINRYFGARKLEGYGR